MKFIREDTMFFLPSSNLSWHFNMWDAATGLQKTVSLYWLIENGYREA